MFKIGKTFCFAASHQLSHLPDGHKCKRLHGHSYEVEIVLSRQGLTIDGFVCDFAELLPIEEWIKSTLDHSHLNDFISKPTCEELASAIFFKWVTKYPNLERVRVSESKHTWGEYVR